MSELLVSALPLSDQIAIKLHMAEKTMANVRALFAAFEPPAETLTTPSEPAPTLPAGGSTPFPTAEHTAMLERQCTDHPPLQVCHPGHIPRMYEATGNLQVRYYVSCGACGVRTARWQSMDAAAHAWASRDVQGVQPAQAVA